MRLFHATRTRLRLLFSRREAEARMNEEMRFHLDMEADRLVREERLDPAEARRRARISFGLAERHKDEMRDGRGFGWMSGLSLDFKLGLRMLVKYPGLTVVGGLAMAFAVWVGVVVFEMVGVALYPTLPLPGGDRIVQLRNWDVLANDAEPHALHDFLTWRRTLASVTDLGASRNVAYNLVTSDGNDGLVVGAQVTASAFRIAPDRPLLGRTLVAADERVDAPPVAVLGYDVWRTRFASDPQILGKSVKLDDAYATVVGVMPKGFAFPVSHELWTPLHAESLDRGPLDGPEVDVFGRLASGATLASAQAELSAVGRRASLDSPGTHEHLQPRVARYADMFASVSAENRALMMSFNVFALMLLVLVCGNVALLLFARAATRESEIVVRSALGASRRRIVAQLFAEALVLGGYATVIGLIAADRGLRVWGRTFLERNVGRLPFWIDPHVSPASVAYAIGLTILGAMVAGILPALKVTRGLGTQLRARSAGAGGMRFGGVWTAIIVAQVAVTVAFPAIAWVEQRELVRIRSLEPGFAVTEYLGVQLQLDASPAAGGSKLRAEAAEREAAARQARFDATLEALRHRVEAEPGVAGVTFVDHTPGTYHRERWAELDLLSGAGPNAAFTGYRVSTALIDPSYFAVFESPILAGRAFRAVDLAPDARVAIVDRGFVDQVLKGRNPIGVRLRLSRGRALDPSEPESARPWFEIVGVVRDLGMSSVVQTGRPAGVYLPATPANAASSGGVVSMVVHVRGEPMAFAPRLRTMATAVDPTLRLSALQRLDAETDAVLWVMGLWLRITMVLSGIALLLSLAGIFAVLSFTVAQRTREIGIRVALGAGPRRVVGEIFRRPLKQVALGVVAGGILVTAGAYVLVGHVPDGGTPQPGAATSLSLGEVVALASYVAFMFAVCLLACIVPTRRALSVEPTEALRVE